MILNDAINNIASFIVMHIRGNDIKAKSTRAVTALSIGTFAGHGMKFVRRMVLAKLLTPAEIGIMAIVISLSIAFEAFTEVGIKQSVIQNKNGADPDYLNMAWWMQAVRGFCLFLIAFYGAPWLSSFYEKPQLLILLRVCFLAILFKGLVNPRAYVLEKEFKFGRAVVLIHGSAILGAIITIVLAFMIRNVWALVIGFVSEMVILCVSSFILVPFMPKFKIHKESLSELMKYARGIFGLPILVMISLQAPILVLGKIIQDEQLGLYSYAALLAYFPIDIYGRIAGPILLPAFSEKQSDNKALSNAVYKTSKLTAFMVIPLIAFLICCSDELLELVYKPQYALMAVPFSILCIRIFVHTQGMVLSSLYLAVGRPYMQRRFAVVRTVIIVAFIYPASVRYGILGAVTVIIAGNIVLLLMQIIWSRSVIGLGFNRYIRSYIPGLLLALPIVLTFVLLWLFRIEQPIYVVSIEAFVFVVTFITGFFILNRQKLLPVLNRKTIGNL